MINLEEIVKKLDKILNGIDPDIPTGLANPVTDEYFFMVFSEGLYLSTIADMRAGTRKNFIPVVVGAYPLIEEDKPRIIRREKTKDHPADIAGIIRTADFCSGAEILERR